MSSTSVFRFMLGLGLCLALPECSPQVLAESGGEEDVLLDPGMGEGENPLLPTGRTYLLTLDAGAFPPTAAHPSALVYLPTVFNPTSPVSFIVYIHGFN